MATAAAQEHATIETRHRSKFRGATPTRPEWSLAAPLGLVYVVFFLAPLLLLLWISFHNDTELNQPGFGSWIKFWSDPFYVGVVFKTLKLGLLTVLAATILSYPIALFYYEAGARPRKIILFIVILPLLLSVVIRTFAWIAILSREGVANATLQTLGLTSEPITLLQTEFGLILSLMQIEMPLMLLPHIAVMKRNDPRMDDSCDLAAGLRLARQVLLEITSLGLPTATEFLDPIVPQYLADVVSWAAIGARTGRISEQP